MNIHRCRFVDYTPHSITALSFNYSSLSSNSKPPSNLRLAVGRSNGDIEIWNPRWSWVHEFTLKGGQGRSIEGLAWSKDGKRLFSIGGSTSITEWNLNSGLPIINHDCNSGVIWSLAISPNGEQLAAGCDNGTIVLLDITDGINHLRILPRTNSRIMSLAWKGDNQIVSGCSDGRIRVWSTESNSRIISTMRVDKSRLDEPTLVWSVLVLPNKQIVSGDSTGSIKIWDGQNFSLSQSFKNHQADILSLSSNFKGDTIFSAGVDRKIFCYKILDSKSKKWSSVTNRLLHANDIRAMTIFEAKGSSFLISGGVETSLVINSVNNFMGGAFRKIPITRHNPCVQAIPEPRLIMLWNDQSIKIWKVDEYVEPDNENSLIEEKGKRLVAKITLSNEENVTSASISNNGQLLAVSTLSEIKFFELIEDGKKLLINKVAEDSDITKVGASMIKFTNDSKRVIIISPESEVIIYNIKKDEIVLENEEESDDEDLTSTSSSASPLGNNIYRIAISNNDKYLATAKPNGQINIYDINSKNQIKSLGVLSKFSSAPTALKFTHKNTLIVATAEIKVLEYDVGTKTLTPWSRRNSDLLPQELVNSIDKCCGIFIEPSNLDRVWLWGANWLAFIDLTLDLPIQRVGKRKIDLLSMEDEENKITNEDVRKSIPSSTTNGNKSNGTSQNENNSSSVPYWMTTKYRPMLLADTLGSGELVVIERPPFDVPLPPAFWSNNKFQV